MSMTVRVRAHASINCNECVPFFKDCSVGVFVDGAVHGYQHSKRIIALLEKYEEINDKIPFFFGVLFTQHNGSNTKTTIIGVS